MNVEGIGKQLRLWRERAGVSQRSLAKRAGVPSSSVSLIENDRISPSVSSLKRLLDAMGISLSEFFSDEVPTESKTVFRSAELPQLGRGGVSYRQVGRNLHHRKIQMLYEEYQPGSSSGKAPLVHEGEEVGIVIDGTLELTVDGEMSTLGPGDAYLFESSRPHSFRNKGSRVCIVVSACTPPSF